FEVIAHDLNGLERLAIGPNLFRLFVFRIALAFHILIEDELFDAMRDQMRDIAREQDSEAENTEKTQDPISHHAPDTPVPISIGRLWRSRRRWIGRGIKRRSLRR